MRVGEIKFNESDANEFSYDVLTKVYSSWENLYSFFEQKMKEKMDQLDSICKLYQTFEKKYHEEWVKGDGVLNMERKENKCLVS